MKATNRRPAGYRRVLTTANAKTSKGEKLGFLTGILYLAPSTEAGRANLCAAASEGCKQGCLFTAGRGRMKNVKAARIAKTHFFFDQRETFLACLRYDVRALIARASRQDLVPVVRVNGTSDLPWLALLMAAEFPDVVFYDYTKLPRAWERVRTNYHLTFSHSETNEVECLKALENGLNVAVVFDVKRGKPLPESFLGRAVVDGDLHDLRFLDGYQGAVIGLRAKGPAKKDCSGFVVKSPALVQIALAA